MNKVEMEALLADRPQDRPFYEGKYCPECDRTPLRLYDNGWCMGCNYANDVPKEEWLG